MFVLDSPHHGAPLIVPQAEHARLSAGLAVHWGNDAFDRPALPWRAFVAGVALHDWHYGELDELVLGDAADWGDPEREALWLATTRRALDLRHPDPLTDAVAKRHTRRLLGDATGEAGEVARSLDQRVEARRAEAGVAPDELEWADGIARCCDQLAYDIWSRRPARSLEAPARRGGSLQTLAVTMEPGRRIAVAPWPFASPSFAVAVIAYARAGYPERLVPMPLSIEVAPVD